MPQLTRRSACWRKLGIEGMQLKSYEKGDVSPGSAARREITQYPAATWNLLRECGGGSLDIARRGQCFRVKRDCAELYCAPFSLESVTLLISEEGVESFLVERHGAGGRARC